MRYVIAAVLIVALSAAAAFIVAGRATAPEIKVLAPSAVIGQNTTLEMTVESPGGSLSRLDVVLEQDGRASRLFDLGSPTDATVQQDTPERIRLTRPIGSRAIPSLAEGTARLVVTASRPVVFGLRSVSATASLPLRVRLTPPRVAVVSSHMYVNHGGAELVLYSATPPESVSGVRVGDCVYSGFPASGLGVAAADPSLKAALFALLHDQDLTTPVQIFARDEAGNETLTSVDAKVFPKPFRKSRIEVTDQFLAKVVPPIVLQTPEIGPVPATADELLAAYLKINRDLRQQNAERIRSMVSKTADRALWSGRFVQLANSKVESGFADRRVYFYRGQEIDQQVHLGIDLAVTEKVAVAASNAGTVVFADYLGIYGNTVIVDHGMGLQSLYAHLSSMAVRVGDTVSRGTELGRSGTTGLAGGDHVHFAILVGGYPVSPVEWWDEHWIEDRIARKITEASR